jgi:hypothetical protein
VRVGEVIHNPMPDANLTETKNALMAQGIKYCLGAYVDIHGVPKGKIVPVAHFEDFAGGSELYTGYALDGLGQSPNDDEIASVPDLARGIRLPWRPDTMWYPADNTFKGEPYPIQTRVAFKNVLAEAAAMGFGFNLGIECEVYFLKLDAAGRLVVPNADDDLMKSCYDVKRAFDVFPMLDEIVTTLNDLGWDVYSFDHEDGNSQFEFDFKFADGLTMADRYVFFRHLAKTIAARHGLLATFMPKPFADKTGNGAHFNMSLSDAAGGANLFKATPGDDPYGIGLSRLGLQFVAGILRHGRALCAAFAPTVNSYKRLIRRGPWGTIPGRRSSTASAPTTAPTRCGYRWAAAAASRATPIRPATRISPARWSWRPDWRASANNSTPDHPSRTTSTSSPTPNSPRAASLPCPAPWPKRWPPSPRILLSKRPSAADCATSSSPASRPSGMPTT